MKCSVSGNLIIFIAFTNSLFASIPNSELDQEHSPLKKAEQEQVVDKTKDSKEKEAETTAVSAEHKSHGATPAENDTAAAKAERKSHSENPDTTPGPHTAKGAQEALETVKIGNLAFPPSQQPSPLVSIGQNIINRKQLQAQLSANEFKGEDHQYFINVNPALIYAFTDSLALFLAAPFAARYREDQNHHSSGPADVIIQLEYAFYTKAHRTYYDQATIVTNVTIPTGSTKKHPPTGFGANTFFLGGTYGRMGINWFGFVSSGVIAPSSSHKTRFGNQFLYQLGFGRRIANTKEWLLDWMIEIDGIYDWKNTVHNRIDPHSGGNVINLTPSLWYSTSESLFLQVGLGVPIQQTLFGHQKKNRYVLLFNSGWVF